jgi:hypothetical protein
VTGASSSEKSRRNFARTKGMKWKKRILTKNSMSLMIKMALMANQEKVRRIS